MFGSKWNFVTSRSSRIINCNRTYRQGNVKKPLVRKSSSITYGCGRVIRFRYVNRGKSIISDPVVVKWFCGVHSNTCYPSLVDQFFSNTGTIW